MNSLLVTKGQRVTVDWVFAWGSFAIGRSTFRWSIFLALMPLERTVVIVCDPLMLLIVLRYWISVIQGVAVEGFGQ